MKVDGKSASSSLLATCNNKQLEEGDPSSRIDIRTTFKSSYNLAITLSFSAFEQMGSAASKGFTRANDKPKNLRTIRLLEKELMEQRSKKQGQTIAHEDRVMLFTAKEAGWKRERKMWTEEMDKMRKQLDEKGEKIRRLEEELLIMDGNGGKEWYLLEVGVLLEQMQEEQALRQEAVEKWKGLYLAIKSELDDLIQRTCQGIVIPTNAYEL